MLSMKKKEPYQRKSKITVPARCHPLAKVCFAEMNRLGVTYEEMEWKSGVLRSTWKSWRTNNRPGLDTVEAVLGVLGYSVLPVPTDLKMLPPELRADLEALASKHGMKTLPCLEFIAAAVGRRPTETIDARARMSAPC